MEDYYLEFPFKERKPKSHVRIYNPNAKETLLSLHGIGSSSKESFDEFSRYLTSGCRLVAPDWIGFGESTRLLERERERDEYGADYCSEWYGLFLKNAQDQGILPEKFDIFSISMSGIPVAQTYQKQKEKYGKIIFQNPAGLDKRINKGFAFLLSSGMINQTTARFFLSDLVWNRILKWKPSKREKLVRGLEEDNGRELEVLLRYGHSGFTPFGKMRTTHYIPEKFEEIKNIPLLIYSENDEIFYEQRYLKFAKEHGWKTAMLSDAKHSVISSNPKQVANIINPFLEN